MVHNVGAPKPFAKKMSTEDKERRASSRAYLKARGARGREPGAKLQVETKSN